MLERQVAWSRDALRDITDQLAFIAKDNPTAALKVAAVLREAGDGLRTFAAHREGRMASTFEKVVQRSPYIIAYSIDANRDGSQTVNIIRVIHSSRDWSATAWPDP